MAAPPKGLKCLKAWVAGGMGNPFPPFKSAKNRHTIDLRCDGNQVLCTTRQKLTSSAWRARWWRLFAPKPDRRRANARCPCALQLPPRRPQHASAAKGLMSPRFFSAAAFPWRSSMSGWFCLSSEPSKFWRRTRAGIRDAKP